ncbi:MAG: hypothetical protein E6J91_48455 [Deltaproteobacteria bacterium]|nr:MAG: hypothetical protein E6J91_48455 [Deltaproteobacteria bacterium]
MRESIENPAARDIGQVWRLLFGGVVPAALLALLFSASPDVTRWVAIAITGVVVLASGLSFVAQWRLSSRPPLPAARVVQLGDRDGA